LSLEFNKTIIQSVKDLDTGFLPAYVQVEALLSSGKDVRGYFVKVLAKSKTHLRDKPGFSRRHTTQR